jgi:hypothetical protein
VKKLITYSLIFSVMLVSLSKAVVVTSFLVNQDLIASKYCENKNAPQKKCKGNCYLNKSLEKSENKSVPISSQILEEFVWCAGSEKVTFNYLFFFSSKLIHLSNENESYSYSYISSIVHPPSA